MGIPLYFNWIIKKFDKLIINSLQNIDILYLDMNCLIHPACRLILDKYKNETISKEKLEKKMCDEVEQYIVKLLKISQPRKKVILAIDGPAPYAKMKQQRMRRFRSTIEKEEIKKIKKKLNYPEDKTLWDTNAITPGTEFMYDLSIHLQKFIKTNELIKDLQVTLSDASTPGEGEHKIMDYIREHPEDRELTHVIYGLDADLIMLALATELPSIYLLREAIHFNKVDTETFLYLDIPVFSKCIVKTVTGEEYKWNPTRIIQDYIVLCFFVGNDFLPHSMALHIGENGIYTLLDVYKKILNSKNEYLCDYSISQISIEFLTELVNQLQLQEDDMLKHFHNSYHKKRGFIRRQDTVFQKECTKFRMKPFLDKHKTEHAVKVGYEGWQDRYYKYFFHIKPNDPTKQQQINDICLEYWKGFHWIFQYYKKGCASWDWLYPYSEAPSLQDFHNFLTKTKSSFYKFKLGEPVKPLLQLMLVLPPQSSELIPPQYQNLMINPKSKIIQYYPQSMHVEFLYKKWFHQCPPALPPQSILCIEKELSKIKLKKKDQKRNIIQHIPFTN